MVASEIPTTPMIGRLTVPSYTIQASGLAAKSILATDVVPAGISELWTTLTACVKILARPVAHRTPTSIVPTPTMNVLKTFPCLYGNWN